MCVLDYKRLIRSFVSYYKHLFSLILIPYLGRMSASEETSIEALKKKSVFLNERLRLAIEEKDEWRSKYWSTASDLVQEKRKNESLKKAIDARDKYWKTTNEALKNIWKARNDALKNYWIAQNESLSNYWKVQNESLNNYWKAQNEVLRTEIKELIEGEKAMKSTKFKEMQLISAGAQSLLYEVKEGKVEDYQHFPGQKERPAEVAQMKACPKPAFKIRQVEPPSASQPMATTSQIDEN